MLSPPLTPSRSFHISTSLPTQLHALSISFPISIFIYICFSKISNKTPKLMSKQNKQKTQKDKKYQSKTKRGRINKHEVLLGWFFFFFG